MTEIMKIYSILFPFFYLTSSIQAYTVKVEGKVEMGSEMAEMFQQLFSNMYGVESPPMNTQQRKDTNHNMLRNEGRGEVASEQPLLEKLVGGAGSGVHVYGKHKETENRQRPLNNVNA